MSINKSVFTRPEAVEFIHNILDIKNVEDRLKADKRKFVDDLVAAIHGKIPFQSISLMAATSHLAYQSSEEVKERCTRGIGGLCSTINRFLRWLLEALEFSVQVTIASVFHNKVFLDCHMIVLIRSLEKVDDCYLVDCGIGYATLHTICLDFEKESPVFRDSFLEYKYIRHEGKIFRMHGKGDMAKRNNPPVDGVDFLQGHWRRFYSFDPDKTTDMDDKADGGAAVAAYCSSRVILTPFVSSPRAMWFPRKRFVAIVNDKVMIENEDGEVVTIVLKSDADILKAYATHFPQLPQDAVDRAVAEWRKIAGK